MRAFQHLPVHRRRRFLACFFQAGKQALQPVRIEDRAFPHMFHAGQPGQCLQRRIQPDGTMFGNDARAAQLISEIHQRTGPFAKVIREAAPSDAQIADVLRATRERQRLDIDAGVTLVIGRSPTPAERDGVWALLSPEVYLLLVDESGWTPEQYERWVAETLERVLPSS